MNRLKKGDQVYIISGKDKGKLGVVSQIVSEERILVDGINLATPKGFYSKSRKSKNSHKNQKLYTIVHLPTQTRRDIEKNHTNFASRIRQDPL